MATKPNDDTVGFTLNTSANVGKVYTGELPELLVRPNTSLAVSVVP
ncbi:hypothetical protein LINBF2_13060 [Limnohabitans sp. INBF002]|nr:hypothetical protein LINBF2_13060 [Limnohabitans sp. INBF002]